MQYSDDEIHCFPRQQTNISVGIKILLSCPASGNRPSEFMFSGKARLGNHGCKLLIASSRGLSRAFRDKRKIYNPTTAEWLRMWLLRGCGYNCCVAADATAARLRMQLLRGCGYNCRESADASSEWLRMWLLRGCWCNNTNEQFNIVVQHWPNTS